MAKALMRRNGGGTNEVEAAPTMREIALQVKSRADDVAILASAAIRVTKHWHWKDIGGKPYLESNGAEFAARCIGLSIRADTSNARRTEFKDEAGTYHMWEVPVTISDHRTGESVTVTGVCSSRDKFLGKIGDEYKDESDVDAANVRRKAEANGIHRAFVTFCGIDGADWGTIAKMFGTTEEDLKSQVGQVQFRKGKQTEATSRKRAERKPQVANPKPDELGPDPFSHDYADAVVQS